MLKGRRVFLLLRTKLNDRRATDFGRIDRCRVCCRPGLWSWIRCLQLRLWLHAARLHELPVWATLFTDAAVQLSVGDRLSVDRSIVFARALMQGVSPEPKMRSGYGTRGERSADHRRVCGIPPKNDHRDVVSHRRGARHQAPLPSELRWRKT